MTRAIICGDDRTLTELRARVLRSAGFDATPAHGARGLREACLAGFPDLIVLCSSLPFQQKRASVEWLRKSPARVPVLLLRGSVSEPALDVDSLPPCTEPRLVIATCDQLVSRPIAALRGD